MICGLLHLQGVIGSEGAAGAGAGATQEADSGPIDLSDHPGWGHDRLVENGKKTKLGVHTYMNKLEENCFEIQIKGACDAYANAMLDFFDLHKEAALELKESCEDGTALGRWGTQAALPRDLTPNCPAVKNLAPNCPIATFGDRTQIDSRH